MRSLHEAFGMGGISLNDGVASADDGGSERWIWDL